MKNAASYQHNNQLATIKIVTIIIFLSMVISITLGIIKGSNIGISFLCGVLIYYISILTYSLIYFSQRGARAAKKILLSLGWAIFMKYLLLLTLCSLILIYTPIHKILFFGGLGFAHIGYIISISLYGHIWR